MVKPVDEWPNDQYVAAEDDDGVSTRFYWVVNCTCPAGSGSPCMKSGSKKKENSWGRAAKGMWSYTSEDEVIEKMVDHLVTSGHHYMNAAEAKELVRDYVAQTEEAIQVWKESPQDRATFRSCRENGRRRRAPHILRDRLGTQSNAPRKWSTALMKKVARRC